MNNKGLPFLEKSFCFEVFSRIFKKRNFQTPTRSSRKSGTLYSPLPHRAMARAPLAQAQAGSTSSSATLPLLFELQFEVPSSAVYAHVSKVFY